LQLQPASHPSVNPSNSRPRRRQPIIITIQLATSISVSAPHHQPPIHRTIHRASCNPQPRQLRANFSPLWASISLSTTPIAQPSRDHERKPRQTRPRTATAPNRRQPLRLVPPPSHPTSTAPPTHPTAANPPQQDPLRASLAPLCAYDDDYCSSAFALVSAHPLEARLRRWEATRATLRGTLLRRTVGVSEPARREYEMRVVVDAEWRPAALGGPLGIHSDILAGRDCELGWEDVFSGTLFSVFIDCG
jgi:proteasome maturation protein